MKKKKTLKKTKFTNKDYVNGEPMIIPVAPKGKATVSNESCCDCGLVHTLMYQVEDGNIIITPFRNTFLSEKTRKIEKYAFKEAKQGGR